LGEAAAAAGGFRQQGFRVVQQLKELLHHLLTAGVTLNHQLTAAHLHQNLAVVACRRPIAERLHVLIWFALLAEGIAGKGKASMGGEAINQQTDLL
jgi:hypothetical protein